MTGGKDDESWPVRGTVIAGVSSVVILVGGFFAWASWTNISGAVVAQGQVEVESRSQVVQHPDGGVVAGISVSEGDAVKAGEVLISLDGSMLISEHAIVEGQYYETLARRGRLEAERSDLDSITFPEEVLVAARTSPDVASMISGQEGLFVTKRETLKQSVEQLAKQVEQIGSEIVGIEAQETAVSQQRGIIGSELGDQQNLLSRGLTQASRVMALEREAARMDGDAGSLASDVASAGIRRAEIEIQRLRLLAERRETAETELRDLGYRELELAERRRNLAERIERLEIRAPVSGIVHDMRVTTPRSVIRPADAALYIIPQDRPFVIGARIQTINVDEVSAGQDAIIRFSAFPSRTTPEMTATVERISADAMIDEATRAPYYRVELSVSPEEIAKIGDLSVVPGMPVEVYMKTGDRTPLAYLVKPLADYFNKAFRES